MGLKCSCLNQEDENKNLETNMVKNNISKQNNI